jgi:hypothetical protein
LKDSLSDGYKPIEKAELIDIIQLRERWYNESKETWSNFELTYKMEHG